MLKLFLILFISLLFQACQVKEEVASASQIGATTFFPGATLKTVLPANGWKKLGDNIDISLLFPLPITVTNSPYISVVIGSSTRRFYYESGSGTKNLIFRYTVTSVDLDTGGITVSSSITLNGGSLTYSPSAAVVENVPTGLDIPPSEIKVDGVVPFIGQVTAPAGGNYATTQQLKYKLAFSEKVNVTGVPSFSVYLGSGTVSAKYKSGSGSANLEFSRVLVPADSDANGFTSGTLLNLSLISGITITDQAGNSISSTIYATTSTNILVNVVQPTILSVTPPAAPFTYTLGMPLNFTVNMSEAVNVTGTPAIAITLNTGNVLATYVSGSGTASLVFRYTVQTNHVDSNGITLVSPMQLNSGTIKNLAGTHHAALIYTIPATPTILVDAATGPYVVTTFIPSNAMYLELEDLDFTLNFNAVVNVTNFPRLPIIIGTTTVYADYIAGSGTSALVFRYTTTTADSDLDGISLSGPIDLNGGTILDAGNKSAILSYVPPTTVGILVDGNSPTISLVSGTGSGNLITGQHLFFSVKFSEVVTVSAPDPTLSITIGIDPQVAIYISGSGTDTLIFRYTVQVGDEDTDGVDITSPLLTAGTIKDLRGHDSALTFANLTTSGYVVDGLQSTILSITPPVNGTYKIGDTMDFQVNWSEPTYISGSPTLALTVGTSTLHATYIPTGSTTTSFIFRYTVLAGHLDEGGIATTGLQLNPSGLIKDGAGNNADINLFPLPDLSLVFVDGVVPYPTIIGWPPVGIHKAGVSLTFTLLWDQPVNVTGAPVLNLIIGSTPQPTNTCTFVTGITTTGTCTYIIQVGDLDTNGITLLSAVSLPGGATIKDLAGNDSYLQINPPDLTGVKVDAIVPTIISVIAPADGTYKLFDDIDFHVTWSEPVTVVGFPTIALTLDSGGVNATYVGALSPTLSVFRYTVTATDIDPNGISMASIIVLPGAPGVTTIQDPATNDAVLTFTPPIVSGIIVDGDSPTIDPVTPVTPPVDALYGTGANLDFVVHFTENVDVDTTGGTPYVVIYTNTGHIAEYVSGTGTPNITFRYTITAGEASQTSSYWGTDPFGTLIYGEVFLNGGTIQDASLNNAYLIFPVHNWENYTNVIVDAVAPLVSSSASSNITVPAKPNYFKSAHTIEYDITFNEAVTVDETFGTPRLVLDIGGATRYADFDLAATIANGSATSKRFRCILDAGDVLLDLNGIDVDTSIDMNGGSIRDAANNDFVATFSFSEKDYVYYDSTVARYHVSEADYTTAACGAYDCITGVTDITGNGNNLTTSAVGPKLLTGNDGFGTNLTNVMQFNNSSTLNLASWYFYAKYVIFVMKTVNDASITATTSNHILLNRAISWTPTYAPTVTFASTSSVKSINMSPTQKMKINNAAFPVAYTATVSGPTLWAADTPYIMAFELSSEPYFLFQTLIGGGSFKGQIAEIIFLGGAPAINEAKIDTMVGHLNAIHGAY